MYYFQNYFRDHPHLSSVFNIPQRMIPRFF